MTLLGEINFKFFFYFSKLGTHGSPRRRGSGHDPPVKALGLGDVKRYITGMHNTDNGTGKCFVHSIYFNNNVESKHYFVHRNYYRMLNKTIISYLLTVVLAPLVFFSFSGEQKPRQNISRVSFR